MDVIIQDIEDKKDKTLFLKSVFSWTLSAIITAASTLGAFWFFLEKFTDLTK